MKQFTRSEIRDNRQKWINFLNNKKLKKAREKLDNADGSRCCLGHGCYILKVKRIKEHGYFLYGEDKNDAEAPYEFVEMVGLWDNIGSSKYGSKKVMLIQDIHFDSLAGANDCTTYDIDVRPWQIAEYLRSVIEGGENTPFRPLSSYPETIEEINHIEKD